jgi:hypothetical protein
VNLASLYQTNREVSQTHGRFERRVRIKIPSSKRAEPPPASVVWSGRQFWLTRLKRQLIAGLLTKMFHVKRSLVQENETRTCAKKDKEGILGIGL